MAIRFFSGKVGWYRVRGSDVVGSWLDESLDGERRPADYLLGLENSPANVGWSPCDWSDLIGLKVSLTQGVLSLERSPGRHAYRELPEITLVWSDWCDLTLHWVGCGLGGVRRIDPVRPGSNSVLIPNGTRKYGMPDGASDLLPASGHGVLSTVLPPAWLAASLSLLLLLVNSVL